MIVSYIDAVLVTDASDARLTLIYDVTRGYIPRTLCAYSRAAGQTLKDIMRCTRRPLAVDAEQNKELSTAHRRRRHRNNRKIDLLRIQICAAQCSVLCVREHVQC